MFFKEKNFSKRPDFFVSPRFLNKKFAYYQKSYFIKKFKLGTFRTALLVNVFNFQKH